MTIIYDKLIEKEKASENPFKTFVENHQPEVDNTHTWRHFLLEHKKADENHIRATMKSFVGRIEQMPPVKSAIKRQLRKRSIYYLDILDIKDQSVLFRVGCEAGTYIRKLCHDIGKQLGIGAHMSELRRTKVACFTEESLVTLNDIKDSLWYYQNEGNEKYIRHVIQPIEFGVRHIPKIWVLDTTVNSLCHGANLKIPGISKLHSDIKKGDIIAVMTLKDELVCIGESITTSKDIMKNNKGLCVIINKVFMLPGIYPRIEKK